MDRAWPSFMAPPLSSPSTRKICVRCSLLDLVRHQLSGPSTDALAESQRGPASQPDGQRGQLCGTGNRAARKIVHRFHCRSGCDARPHPRSRATVRCRATLHRIADRQYGGYQVPQRPVEIVLGDQDHAGRPGEGGTRGCPPRGDRAAARWPGHARCWPPTGRRRRARRCRPSAATRCRPARSGSPLPSPACPLRPAVRPRFGGRPADTARPTLAGGARSLARPGAAGWSASGRAIQYHQ